MIQHLEHSEQPVPETAATVSGIAHGCEAPDSGLDGCKATAAWLVRVGTRTTDGQRSCGRHLNRTCELMLFNEGRRGATLTITAVRP